MRVYLAPKEMLTAIFHDPGVVDEIIAQRQDLYKLALDVKEGDQQGLKMLSDSFKNQFDHTDATMQLTARVLITPSIKQTPKIMKIQMPNQLIGISEPRKCRYALAAAAKELSTSYRSQNEHQNTHLIATEAMRLAYLAVRMPATFAAVMAVLEATMQMIPGSPEKPFVISGLGLALLHLPVYKLFLH